MKFDVEEGILTTKQQGRIARIYFKHKKEVEEEEGEELPQVSLIELLKLNIPDWYLVLPGVIFFGLMGALFPTLSILFSEVLRVNALHSSVIYAHSLYMYLIIIAEVATNLQALLIHA